jgi:hypothetical protein
MVEIGGFIGVKLLPDSEEQIYFRTKVEDERYGRKYYTFCKYSVKPESELDITDFWGLSEQYFNKLLSEGKLRVIDTVKDFVETF